VIPEVFADIQPGDSWRCAWRIMPSDGGSFRSSRSARDLTPRTWTRRQK
jgi:hypothetical protein